VISSVPVDFGKRHGLNDVTFDHRVLKSQFFGGESPAARVALETVHAIHIDMRELMLFKPGVAVIRPVTFIARIRF